MHFFRVITSNFSESTNHKNKVHIAFLVANSHSMCYVYTDQGISTSSICSGLTFHDVSDTDSCESLSRATAASCILPYQEIANGSHLYCLTIDYEAARIVSARNQMFLLQGLSVVSLWSVWYLSVCLFSCF